MRGIFANTMTVGDAVAWGAATLDESEMRFANSRADSMLLLRYILGVDAAELYAEWQRQLTDAQTQRFNLLIRERQRGCPIQYITGVQEFFGLTFRVTPAVLIPRPETEHLVEAAISRLKSVTTPMIADMGTGSGAIAIALASVLPLAKIMATDISAAAIAVARENAVRNGAASRIQFVESDLLEGAAEKRFDAIVSNPPYIARGESSGLPVEVRNYEPSEALFAGPTGIEIFERLIPQAATRLQAGGWLLMEIAQGQRDAIARLLEQWDAVEFLPDLQGIPRVAAGRKRRDPT